MSLVKCKECGNTVSTEAKSCPQCGAVQAQKTKTSTWVVGAIFAAIIGSCISTTQSEKVSPPNKPPSAEEIAAKKMKETAFQNTLLFASLIKKSMREPDSVVWESIRSNDDGSVVCIEYRGKNGFGGVSKEFAVYANAKSSSKPEAWNKHCARHLNEMKHVRFAVQ